MSTQVNTNLFERAALMVDYFQDKLPAQLIEADLERNDLQALDYHVTAAEAIASQEDLRAYDV